MDLSQLMSIMSLTIVTIILGFVVLSALYFAYDGLFNSGTEWKKAWQDDESPARRPAPPLKASDHVNDGKYHLLLAATGSVATIKIPNILSALAKYENLSIRVLLSDSAAEFLRGQAAEQPKVAELAAIKNVDAIYRNKDEWRKPWVRGDSILHIELRRWADLMVIAPLSANSLAKLALGMSSDLVSSVARAWDTTGLIDGVREGVRLEQSGDSEVKKTIMVAPAMNTAMWNHPVTERHLSILKQDAWNAQSGGKSSGWIQVLQPIDKGLACGDKGGGAMKEWKEIVAAIETKFPDLRERKQEDIDSVVK
jgi:phosphopantothenoylcysteine decarboxylase